MNIRDKKIDYVEFNIFVYIPIELSLSIFDDLPPITGNLTSQEQSGNSIERVAPVTL